MTIAIILYLYLIGGFISMGLMLKKNEHEDDHVSTGNMLVITMLWPVLFPIGAIIATIDEILKDKP